MENIINRDIILKGLTDRLERIEALKQVIEDTDLNPFQSAKTIALHNVRISATALMAQISFVKVATLPELITFIKEYVSEGEIC